MKILVLAESLKINETSSGIVSSTFLKALIKEKNNVTCLFENSTTYPVSWLPDVTLIPVNYSVIENNFIDKIPKLRGVITNLSGYHKEFYSKVIDWRESVNKILNSSNFDLIIVLGTGASFAPHYAMLKINTKIPWIANFHDPYPLHLYPKPYKKKRNFLLKRQEFFTKKIIGKATFVSFPSLYLKDSMQHFFAEIKDKHIILPHIGISLDDLPANDEIKLNFKSDKFNLLHAGTLLGERKINALFKAYERFINSNEVIKNKAVLNILGSVAREHKSLEKENTSNYHIITKRISYKKSLELTAQADVCIIIEANSDFSPFMPGKLADLIYLEKPILALTPDKSETKRILGELYPFHSPVNDEELILEKLFLLWELWNQKKLNLPESEKLKTYISSKMLQQKITAAKNSTQELSK